MQSWVWVLTHPTPPLHDPPHPFMTHPTPPLHDAPTPPHPTMMHPTLPTPSWCTHPTHPYMTHPTPPHPFMTHPTPPHPFMTHPPHPYMTHPTPLWPTPPLHDPPHPTPSWPTHPTPPHPWYIFGHKGAFFHGLLHYVSLSVDNNVHRKATHSLTMNILCVLSQHLSATDPTAAHSCVILSMN